MDPLLPLLVRIAANDDAIQLRDDALRRTRRRLDDLEAAESAASAELATLEHQLAALVALLGADEQELAGYDQQRRIALRSLETGLGNPTVAERQLATSRAAISTIEDRMLERMEQRESVETKLQAARAGLHRLREDHAARRAEVSAHLATLRSEQSAALAHRQELCDQLPREERSTYQQLLKTRGTALAMLRDRVCAACGSAAPLQIAAAILRGGTATCNVCGRWLYSPAALGEPARQS